MLKFRIYNGNRTNEGSVNQSDWLSQQYTSNGQDSIIYTNTKKATTVKSFDPYKIKTGEVETNDTMTTITTEVNAYYGTDYDVETMAKINTIKNVDQIEAGETIQVGTVDLNGGTWKPPYEEGVVDLEYFEGLNESQQKITHYHRRVFEDGDIPKTKMELEKNESKNWTPPNGEAVAHNIGTNGNVDYRGKGDRSNQQAIYDKNGNLETTHENGGSYDYVSPKDGLKAHADLDVEPWLTWGNTPQDTTTVQQRREAMAQKPEGQAGLIYLDGKKKVDQTKEFAKEKGSQAKEVVSNGWEVLKDTFKQKPVPQTQGAN